MNPQLVPRRFSPLPAVALAWIAVATVSMLIWLFFRLLLALALSLSLSQRFDGRFLRAGPRYVRSEPLDYFDGEE